MDVAAALEVVPLRNGELRLVDGLATYDNALHRSGADDHWGDRLAVFLHRVLDKFAIGGIARKTEGKR